MTWRHQPLPLAIASVGTHSSITDRRAFLLRTMQAAVKPGATRDDIVTTAAQALTTG